MSIFYTIGCRLRQAAVRAVRPRRMERQTVVEGTGAVFSVAQVLRSGRLRKPMVVASPGTDNLRERVLHALEESDIPWAVWDMADRDPMEEDVEGLRLAWAREECDCFVALGDRRAIDLGKIAAALAGVRGRSLMSLVGTDKVRRRLPPVIAVPTAAGSGAESLAWASFGESRGGRYVIADRALIPSCIVQDPELMEDVSRSALAEAAVDGLCLALEAYLSGYGDDACRATAADAVKGYLEHLEPCWNSGGTPAQRSALMEASRLAGEAGSAAGPGYARAMSRAAVRMTGLPFGEVCGAILPACMSKYGNHAAARLARLAELTGVTGGSAKSGRAAALIERVRQLIFRIGLPDGLEHLSSEIAAEIGALAAAEANPRYAAPVVWTAADCAAVVRSACADRE